MTERKTIEIPEICRVEGHSAVHVDIEDGKVTQVSLDVFEGTRFFEKIVLDHPFTEMPHITSRVCAICSTGHVLASAFAVENILGVKTDKTTSLFRELMHLGMIIESHATHVYALALPDFLGAGDLVEYATKHQTEFESWNRLRNLGSAVQTTIGGRAFHPINLHVGGLSKFPEPEELKKLRTGLEKERHTALDTCELLMSIEPPVEKTSSPLYLALIPNNDGYGFFGDRVRSSQGWEEDIQNYAAYLKEIAVKHSHAKRSTREGKPFMVGSMARLALYGDKLGPEAKAVFASSKLAAGDTNSIWNNLAQAIEIVESINRSIMIIDELLDDLQNGKKCNWEKPEARGGKAAGAVECPRGTLYHFYELDDKGHVKAADMITPSAQNSYRIETDIKEVVSRYHESSEPQVLEKNLETLVRAYDPCNTCATHMVKVRYH